MVSVPWCEGSALFVAFEVTVMFVALCPKSQGLESLCPCMSQHGNFQMCVGGSIWWCEMSDIFTGQ